MSGSRKKHNTTADGLSQKQRKEFSEAQSTKREKMIYTAVGAVCAVAAAALLIWNGCRNYVNTGAVAATVEEVSYTVPDLQYYYIVAKNSQISANRSNVQAGLMPSEGFGYDSEKSEGEQWFDEDAGITYADHFREMALENLKQTVAVVKLAEESGYTLSEEGEQTLRDFSTQIDEACAKNGLTRSAYFQSSYGHGVTERVFFKNLRNDILSTEYQKLNQTSFTYDDQALEEYYAEHKDALDSYTYRTFVISGTPKDENGQDIGTEATANETAAAKEAASQKANEAVEAIRAASDKETAFETAADTYLEQPVEDSAYENNLFENVSGEQLDASDFPYVSWLKDSSRSAGDVDVIENESNYIVILFLGRERNDDSTVAFRHILCSTSDSAALEAEQGSTDMEAARAEAQKLLDQYLAGEQSEDAFAALANKNSDDVGSNTNGGLYENVPRGMMVEPVNNWIFDPVRQPGDTGIVEFEGGAYSGAHVLYFVGEQEAAWKASATKAKQQVDQAAWLEDVNNSITAEAKDGMKYVGVANTAVPTPPESETEEDELDEDDDVAIVDDGLEANEGDTLPADSETAEGTDENT